MVWEIGKNLVDSLALWYFRPGWEGDGLALAMITEFNERGYLPPGIHAATLEDIAARFGQSSELRRVQTDSLRWLVELVRRAGVSRLVVNGSFVTDKLEPNDVDCVAMIGPTFPTDASAAEELLSGLPFINVELVD